MDERVMSIREQGWLQTIQAAARSGQSAKNWCEQNGIAESTFYRWKHRLREKALASLRPEPADIAQAEGTAAANIPVFAQLGCVEASESDAAIRTQAFFQRPTAILRIRCGDFTLEMGTEVCEEELKKVLRAVRNAW